MRSVETAAASAVAVIRPVRPSRWPSTSGPDSSSGLSSRMYAIAMKVVRPPRSSRATVEPRSDMWKYRSSRVRRAGRGGGVPVVASVVVASVVASAAVLSVADGVDWVMRCHSQGSQGHPDGLRRTGLGMVRSTTGGRPESGAV